MPAGNDAYYSSVVLLLHMGGAAGGTTFTDKSNSPKTVTNVGSISTSNAQKKYNISSMLCASSGKYLTLDNNAGFSFGTGDYTIEFWIYPTSVSSGQYLYDGRPTSTTGLYVALYIGASNKLIANINNGDNITSTNPVVNGLWQHCSLSRVGSNTKLFINGIQEGSTYTTLDNLTNGTSRPIIGQFGFTPSNPNGFVGHMYDLRVTKGVGRYSSNFSVPSEEFYPRDPISTSFISNTPIISLPFSRQKISKHNTFLGNSIYYSTPNSIQYRRKLASISDAVSLTLSQTLGLYISIRDSIYILSQLNSKGLIKSLLVDYIKILDIITSSFSSAISDSVVVNLTLTSLSKRLESILDQVIVSANLQHKALLHNSILNTISIVEKVLYARPGTINDAIVISSTLSSLTHFLNRLTDNILADSSFQKLYKAIVSLDSSFTINSTNSTRAVYLSSILNSFIVELKGPSGSEKYLSYLLAPETNYVTNYDNYNFDGIAKFNSNYLFYNSSGLFKYGGLLDENTKIVAEIETVANNFGTSNLKNVPSAYLGYTSSGATILKVRVDGKAEVVYKLNKKTNNLQTQKIDIGKGLIGRYFQFELISDADTFNLESIDFYPIELRRKL